MGEHYVMTLECCRTWCMMKVSGCGFQMHVRELNIRYSDFIFSGNTGTPPL